MVLKRVKIFGIGPCAHVVLLEKEREKERRSSREKEGEGKRDVMKVKGGERKREGYSTVREKGEREKERYR